MKIETVDGSLVGFKHLSRRELREPTYGVPVVLREGCGYALSSSDCDLLLTDSRRIARDKCRLEDALLWLCKNGDLFFVAIALCLFVDEAANHHPCHVILLYLDLTGSK